jgi:hypothetical protein
MIPSHWMSPQNTNIRPGHPSSLLWTGVLLLLGTQSAMPQSPPPVEQLINELQPCSVLRTELEDGTYGSGLDQPYMSRMRQLGVQRVLLELKAEVRDNRAKGIEVVRRLYFRQFDGAKSQISDEATLNTIEASGLKADLYRIALSRVSTAPIVRGADPHFSSTKQVSSVVEFFANAWLPEHQVSLFRSGRPEPLTGTVVNGDAAGTKALLTSRKFTKDQLNRALFVAAISRYDNRDVIKLLVDAGADVNARTPDGSTPLVSAVGRPCNLRPLLDSGADLNARDKWGRNALQVARETKEGAAVSLLEKSASNY